MVKAAEPEIVPALAKGVSELQQAGANPSPVVSGERFLSGCLPLVVRGYAAVVEGRFKVIPVRVGLSLRGRHIGVASGEVAHKSVPSASIRGAPVEEGRQDAVGNHLSSHV